MTILVTLYFLWIIGQTLVLIAARYWRLPLYEQYRGQDTRALISVAIFGGFLGMLCVPLLPGGVSSQWHIWVSGVLAGVCLLLDRRFRRLDML